MTVGGAVTVDDRLECVSEVADFCPSVPYVPRHELGLQDASIGYHVVSTCAATYIIGGVVFPNLPNYPRFIMLPKYSLSILR